MIGTLLWGALLMLSEPLFSNGFESPQCEPLPAPWKESRRGLQRVEFNNFRDAYGGATYFAVFGELPWPGRGGTYRWHQNATEYVSLPFVVPLQSGIQQYEVVPQPGSALMTISVSACRGGVLTPISPDCISYRDGFPSGFHNLRVSTDPMQAACVVEAGEQYFFNMAMVDRDDLTSWCTALDGRCWQIMALRRTFAP